MLTAEALPDLASVRAEKARRDLRLFVEEAWPIVEPVTPFVSGWHIDAICEHLEAATRREIRNLLVTVPPRHMKSLCISVFWPTWLWATEPEARWIFASYAQSLAVRDSLKCRRIIESPWYQRHFGHVFRLTSDQNQKTRFENDKTGYRIATSVEGSATGEGGSVIVCDDPHNVQEAHSDAIRESTIRWWDEVMSTRLDDARTGVKVVVMQRVHMADLAGHVLEQGGYEHLNLPAEYEPTTYITSLGWQDPRKQEGELLWEERFGLAEIQDAKQRLGSYGYNAQYQQRPAPPGGGIFRRDWWRFYDALPGRFDEVIQSWDMAFKNLQTSDFVVGEVWGRVGADKYLLDQVRERMSFTETLRAMRALTEKWPAAGAKLVEDKANGTAVIDTLRHEIAGLVAVEPEGGKEARAYAVSPDVEAGNVYLPNPLRCSWVQDYIEELAIFPKAPHDDQVDATTQALLRLGQSAWQDPGALDLGADLTKESSAL